MSVPEDNFSDFSSVFDQLEDPRVVERITHPLTEILFVIISGSVCCAESWRDFVSFAEEKIDFLREHFPYENGIPSKNTLSSVMASIDPNHFKNCFIAWVKSLQKHISGVIAIDGKTLCNSFDKADENARAIHMVSAFASQTRLVLAQQKVDKKSNEITSIPKLLDLLDLKNNIVTLDAMGCQKSIAKKIIETGGDYIFSLKGNQGTLNTDIRLFLEAEINKENSRKINDVNEKSDAGHGRIETRTCYVSDDIDWLSQIELWPGLKTIAMIEVRQIKGDKESIERRFFITSLEADAEKISSAVRAHWSIENSLHWTLDVVFNEDGSRVRKDNAPENMAIIRHIVLNMLNGAKKNFKGSSIKGLRKKAGWGNSTNFDSKLLMGQPCTFTRPSILY